MSLHVSGVKIPKLGSSEDIVLRGFLLKQANKELYKNKLLAQLAMSTAGGQSEVSKTIVSAWNNYVNLETFMEDEVKQREVDMHEEYRSWVNVKPKLGKSSDGKFIVSGIPLDKYS